MNPLKPSRVSVAMTRLQFSLCCVLAVAVGCKKDATFSEVQPPQAAVHWIHAVPDTGEMDMRPIDIISNAGLFDAVFRGSTMFYQGIEAGTRHIRVFMSSPNPASMGNVDVRFTRHATDTLPDTPAVAAIGYKAIGTYVPLVRDSLAADSVRVVVTAAGTKTPVLFSIKLPRGTAGTTISNPIAGASVAGSVLTAVIVPASVVGSTAPQGGAFAAPSAVFLVDRRPANTIP